MTSKTSGRPPRLPIRARKALGSVILLIGLIAYALAAVWVAVTLLPDHWAVELIYYPVAGIAWAFPARYLITWMQRPDGPNA